MKRRTKAFLSLALSAAMMFSGLGTQGFAAEKAKNADTEIMMSDMAADSSSEAAESSAATADKELQSDSGDVIEEALQEAEDEGKAYPYTEVYGEDETSRERCAEVYDNYNGIVYLESGEWEADVWGENEEGITEAQIKDNYLARSDGSRVDGACTSESYVDNEIYTYFYFTKPIGAGEYDAVVETTDGKKVKYAKVIVKDKPTIVSVSLTEDSGDTNGYDSSGEYIHIAVEGVGLGNGRSAKPYLTISGNKVAEKGEVFYDGRFGGYFIYRLEKTDPDSEIWSSVQDMKVSFAGEGIDTSLVSDTTIKWKPGMAAKNPFEHIYYDAKNNVTRFQFKPGLKLQGKKNVKLTAKEWDESTEEFIGTAEGTGDIDENGLLSIALKKDGKDFIPVEQDKSGETWKEFQITCSDPDIDAWAWIFRYDVKPAEFDGYDIESPTDIVYTTDKSFNPMFTISDDILKGSGDITAEVAGHSYKLAKSGDFYTAEISLGDGLEEGRHKVMLHQGDTVLGSVYIDSILPGKFYQIGQSADFVERSDRRALITLKSPDIMKKYYEQRNDRGIGDKIWREQDLSLELRTPDGEELTYTDPVYDFDGSSFYVFLTLPEKIRDYYGCYPYFRSNDKYGASGDHPEKSYYEDGTSRARPKGYWGNVHEIDIERDFYKGRYNKDGKIFAVRAAENFSDYIKYPLTISFARVNETTPVKTLSIAKTDMEKYDENWYFFTEDDLSGLNSDEPYIITAYDSSRYATSACGYVTGADDHYSYTCNHISKIEILQGDPEIAVGEECQLGYTSFPWDERVNEKDVSWTSSDESIATVDKSGLVKGVEEGTANITVAVGGKSDSVSINVIKDPVPLTALSISENSLELEPGESKTIGVIKTPEDATDKITFNSSDPAVASVDDNGVVSANKIGKAIITVQGGEFEATCEVTVHRSFKLQKDNNHFANYYDSFFKKDAKRTYNFRDNGFYDKLKKLAGADEGNYLTPVIERAWGGSCYGIAMTMGLVLTGRLSINDLTDDRVPYYHLLSAPVNDDRLFDSINYYQAGQLLKQMYRDTLIAEVKPGDAAGLKTFLQKLVEKTAYGDPVLFSYGIADSGHAILALNSRYDEGNHRYIVTMYDENTAAGFSSFETEEFTEMTVSDDFSSFDYTTVGKKLKLQDVYKYMIIRDPGKYPLFTEDDSSVNNVMMFANEGGGTVIDLPWAAETTVKNDKGESVTLADGETSGNMKVDDVKYFFADDASRIQVEVKDSDSFTVSSNNLDMSIITSDKVMSISGDNIDSATLSLKDNKVSISGNNYSFNVAIKSQDSDSLLSMEGKATGNATVAVAGDTVEASTEGTFSELSSTTYNGNESKQEKIEVSEDGKGAKATHKETAPRSGADPEPEITEDNEVYLVKGQTFRIGSTGWKTEGSSKAITLSAKNGVTTVTAKKAASDGVTISDGKVKYKVFVAVPSATINNNKSAKLVAGNTAEVKISGIPADKMDKYSVAWVSAKTEVASVAPSSGNVSTVTAVGKGSTNITAYVGGKAYSCKVTVIDDGKNVPKTVGVSANITLNPTQTVSLKYSSFTAKNAVWTSKDSTSMNTVEKDKKGNPTASGNGIVKIVSKNGKITAIGEGETSIQGTDTTGRTVTLNIKVLPIATNPVAYVRCNKTVTLKAPKLKKNKTKWSVVSGNEYIQSLNNGKVKAVSALPSSARDCAEISCKFTPYDYGNGFEYTFRVYVENPSLNTSTGEKGLKPAGSKKGQYVLELKKGESFSLAEQYSGIHRGVIWKNSKPTIAYVDENGIVHANGSGITGNTNLSANIGGVTLKVTVKVTGE